MGETALSQKRK